MSRYTRPLQQLSRSDEPSVGGKSANLGELLAAEIPVPPGFALSTAAFEAFMAEADLERTAEDALAAEIRATPVPAAVREEVTHAYAALAEAVGIADPPVAVRSSAVGEDSQQATFAGQQETYLWVRGGEGVCDAVRDCWASLYSPTAIAYRARLGDRAGAAAMGVTVQLMVDADVSGVMFTCSPVSGDPSMVAINASWGLGLAVVGGEVSPDEYLVSKVTREVVRERVHAKDVQYVPDAGGNGAVRVDVPDHRREMPCLNQAALNRLVDVARRIERYFGCPQDIEWAFARDDPDGLFVVQARPVTGLAKKAEMPKAQSAMSLIMSSFGAGPAKDP
ncbi:MAG TPA: PEP/pyruvate-binding domain-containing protein [Solirubrobacteraceae bacterium]|nr:PEP/pyruvate-binding domain-containing protein [Solirubrobacteraceae bacterium]